MAKLSKLSKQVAIRMENDLIELLEDDAKRYGRTVAQTIRFRLRQALGQEAVRGAVREVLAKEEARWLEAARKAPRGQGRPMAEVFAEMDALRSNERPS